MEPCLSVHVAADSAECRGLTAALNALGHNVRAGTLAPDQALGLLRGTGSDLVVVPGGECRQEALRLIAPLGREGYPVVVVLELFDAEWLADAIVAGAGGVALGADVDQLRIAIQLAWQRSVERGVVEEAFARRAVIEQAKGLIMARYGTDSERAFALLREQSQSNNRKLADLALALVRAHAIMASSAASGAIRQERPVLSDRPADQSF